MAEMAPAGSSTNVSCELFAAVRAGDVAAVGALLDRDPALVDARDDGGMAPVITAAYLRRREVADLLLARGAELDVFAAAALGRAAELERLLAREPGLTEARSPDGWTPLHLAAHFGQERAVEALLASGADVHARSGNAMQNTPLHAALAGRSRGVAARLLAAGADVNARQEGGYTALHEAALLGDANLAQLLLDHGADPTAAAADGRTPAALAREKGHHAVAAALERSAAMSDNRA